MYHEGIAASANLSSRQWEVIEGGAWEFVNVDGDPRRPNYFYVLGGQLSRRRYPGTGAGDFIISFGDFPASSVAVDLRHDSNTLLVASSNPGRIMRALDGNTDAPTWTTEPGVSLGDDPIVSIAFAPGRSLNPRVLPYTGMTYAVSSTGVTFRKLDANSSDDWDRRGQWQGAIGAGGVAQLAVNAFHSDRLYLIAGTQIVMSPDGGATWGPIGGTGRSSLPPVTLTSIVAYPFDALTLFVSGDVGVFVSRDEGATWARFDQNLPNAQIIEIIWSGPYLYAVTYGRGLWRRNPCL